MFKDIQAIIDKISDNRRKYQTWQKVVSVLACITVFCTTYALILPAITLESSPDVICGMEEHAHTSDCYQRTPVLICENTDSDHEHTDECYQIDSVLICGKEEHKHSDACFPKVASDEEDGIVGQVSSDDPDNLQDPSDVSSGETDKEVVSEVESKLEGEVSSEEPSASVKRTDVEAKAAGEQNSDDDPDGEAIVEPSVDVDKPKDDENDIFGFNGFPVKRSMTRVAKFLKGSLPRTSDVVGVESDKRITGPDENGVYEITLEAYVTGNQSITVTNKVKPVDIILVLDQSGSMSEPAVTKITYSRAPLGVDYLSSGKPTNDWWNHNKDKYYVKTTSGTYVKVKSVVMTTTTSGRKSTYKYTYTFLTEDGTTITETFEYKDKSSPFDPGEQIPQIPGYNLAVPYKAITEIAKTRMDVLIDAAKEFTKTVATNAKGKDGNLGTDDDVDHRIALVGFAGGANNGYEETVIIKNKTKYGYGQSAQSVYASAFESMLSPNGETTVKDSIDKLVISSSTHIDNGLELANGIYSQNSGDDRNRVVVVFTDGVPGESEFWNIVGKSSETADNAIAQASILKNTYHAKIYAVGVFSGADASSEGTMWDNNVNHTIAIDGTKAEALERSAPYANKFMQLLSSNNGVPKTTDSFFLAPSEASELTSEFVEIASTVSSGGATVDMNSDTVIKDVVSEYFVPASADTSSVRVYSIPCSGADDDGKAVFVDSAQNFDWEKTENGSPLYRLTNGTDITVSRTGKSISVKGFNFSSDYNWCGPIVSNGVISDYNKGHKLVIKIPVVVEENFIGGYDMPSNDSTSGIYDEDKLVEDFPIPTVDILTKVDQYPEAKGVNKTVYYGTAVNASELYFYKNDQNQFVPFNTKLIELGNFITNGRTPVNGIYYIGDTEYIVDLTDAAPGSEGAEESHEYSAVVKFRKKGSNDAWQGFDLKPKVYVLVPQLAWQDTHCFFGQPYTAADCMTYNLDTVNTNWVPDGKLEGTAPKPESNAPYELNKDTLNVTFEVSTATTPPKPLSDDYTLPPVDVNANVKAVSVGNEDITDIVKFNWSCDDQHANPGTKEFIIHVKSGVQLPATGGSGTKIWLIIGLTLMTVPIMIGLSIKRKHDLINVF